MAACETVQGAGEVKKTFELGQSFTNQVKASVGTDCDDRTRKIFCSLVQHMHDFIRENELTMDEFLAGTALMNAAGAISNEKRNEAQLLFDTFGVESLIDAITFGKLKYQSGTSPTATAILGPYWRKDAPKYPMGATIVQNGIGVEYTTYMSGRVVDACSLQPIKGAELDVWHTAPNGLYEQQDPEQPDMNLRGRFTTGPDGKYAFYCLRPVSYPIPDDGPGAEVLRKLDRHFMRPAHIHFIVSAPGYTQVVTQVFDRSDQYISNDAVFAVKNNLTVEFEPISGDPKAQFRVSYDFRLAKPETSSAR